MNEVKDIPEQKYKQIVRNPIDKLALEYLKKKKLKHKKVRKLIHI